MFAKILGFLGLSSCANYENGEARLKAVRGGEKMVKLEVLFIGNSYSFGVPSEFRRLASRNGKRIKVSRATIGGWSLQRHIDTSETLEKLRGNDWDIVVIQDHSLHPGSPEAERKKIMDPGVKFFTEEAKKIGAIPMLYQTWGRRDGDERIPSDDFYQMNERVRAGYKAASKKAGGVTIVPVGDAWEEVYRSGKGAELFEPDGSHPSSFGDKISARKFYEIIFNEAPKFSNF